MDSLLGRSSPYLPYVFLLDLYTSDSYLWNLQGCVASISPVERIGARIGILFAVLSTGALAGSPTAGLFVKTKDRESFDRLILYTVGGRKLCFHSEFVLTSVC